jgi:hypothetical protein
VTWRAKIAYKLVRWAMIVYPPLASELAKMATDAYKAALRQS